MLTKLFKKKEIPTNHCFFHTILTPFPVSKLNIGTYDMGEKKFIDQTLQLLLTLFKEKTRIPITTDYKINIIHIDEILHWEKTKKPIGPFFTSIMSENTLRYMEILMATARLNKDVIVVEIDDENKLDLIDYFPVKHALKYESVLIE